MITAIIKKMDYSIAPYPNAATIRQMLHKVMDFLLALACCAGIAAVLLLMVTLA